MSAKTAETNIQTTPKPTRHGLLLAAHLLLCTLLLGLVLLAAHLAFSIRDTSVIMRERCLSLPALMEEQQALIQEGEDAYADDYRLLANQAAYLMNQFWNEAGQQTDVFYQTDILSNILTLLDGRAIALFDADGSLYAGSAATASDQALANLPAGLVEDARDHGRFVGSTVENDQGQQELWYAFPLDCPLTAVLQLDPRGQVEYRESVIRQNNLLGRVLAGLDGSAYLLYDDGTAEASEPVNWQGAEGAQLQAALQALAEAARGSQSNQEGARLRSSLAALNGVRCFTVTAAYDGQAFAALIAVPLKALLSNLGITLCVLALLFVILIAWTLYLKRQSLLPDVAPAIKVKFRGLARAKARPGLWVAVALTLAVIFFFETLSSVDQLSRQTNAEAQWLRQELLTAQERVEVLQQENQTRYETLTTTIKTILSLLPEIDRASLARLSLATDAQFILLFDMEGNEKLSDSYYVGLSLDDPVTLAAFEPFQMLRKGVRMIYTEPLDDPLTRTRCQYVGVTPINEKMEPFEIAIVCFEPKHLDQLSEIVSEQSLIHAAKQRVLSLDPADGKVLYASDESYEGLEAAALGFTEPMLRDGFDGFASVDGSFSYVSVFAFGAHRVAVAHSGSILLNVLRDGLISGLLILLVLVICFYPRCLMLVLRQQSRLRQDEPQEADHSRAAVSSLNSFGIVMLAAVGLLSLLMVLLGEISPQSLIGRILHRQWNRGFNVFSLSYAIITTAVLFSAIRLLRAFLIRVSTHLGSRGETILRLISSLIHYLGIILLIFYDLSVFGVNTATLLTSAGILSLIVGMGANSTISDILAGLFLIFEGNIRVGDTIQFGNTCGVVQQIGVRTTRLLMESQDIKVVNNAKIGEMINKSINPSTVAMEIAVQAANLPEAENKLRRALPGVRKKNNRIIGDIRLAGVTKIEKDTYTLRIAFDCLEEDREALILFCRRELHLSLHPIQQEQAKQD